MAPKHVDIDASLAKNTRIGERTNLELQVEGLNRFNHPNFRPPNQTLYTGVAADGSGIPNPLAGQIVNTLGTSREVQLALKFEF